MIRHVLLLQLLIGAAAGSQQTLRVLSWKDAMTAKPIDGAEIVSGVLRIDSAHAGATNVFPLMTIADPGIESPWYALTGKIKYEDVEGVGYLELWNHFADGKAFFSRTFAAQGPMQTLRGSADWREFAVPFTVRDASGWLPERPVRLQFNLVLKGKGTVFISPVKLVQYEVGDDPAEERHGWWDERVSAALGAVLGFAGGIMGALVGCLSALGKARKTVLGLLGVMLCVGVAAIGVAIAALVAKQPFRVVLPVGLLGVVLVPVSVAVLPAIRKRYGAGGTQGEPPMGA